MALRLAMAAPLIAIDKQLVHTLFFVHDRVSARFVNPSHVASFPASSFGRSCITQEAEKWPRNNEARSLNINRALCGTVLRHNTPIGCMPVATVGDAGEIFFNLPKKWPRVCTHFSME